MKVKPLQTSTRYIAFLRGINVGGHHKVPMTELQREMGKLGMSEVITMLNSGNVIFNSHERNDKKLENEVAVHLEQHFKFPIPVLLRKDEEILNLISSNPFSSVEVNKDIRLYISFLPERSKMELTLPWISVDNSFRILQVKDKNIYSVLDLSKSKTVKGMESLEKLFGKNITTRNWNTIIRIGEKLMEKN